MPTTGWQAGGALFQACPALPGHLCPARPTITSSAATSQAAPRPPMPPLAAPPPCCTTAALRLPAPAPAQSGALHHHQACHLPPNSSICKPERGRGNPPAQPPGREGETFCKHANLAPCHPASNGGATLVPSARSWQCISNANSCQLLPTLGNLRWSARKGEQQKP